MHFCYLKESQMIFLMWTGKINFKCRAVYLLKTVFIFVSAFVHLDRTCIYSHMLRMVLAFGELLLTVSTESYSVDQHCGMAANANILGNSSKSIRDPGWFVGLFGFFFPFSISRDGRRVGKLWIITPSSSSSEVSHSICFILTWF